MDEVKYENLFNQDLNLHSDSNLVSALDSYVSREDDSVCSSYEDSMGLSQNGCYNSKSTSSSVVSGSILPNKTLE